MENITEIKAALLSELETIKAELSSIGSYNPETDDWEAKPEQEEGGSDADENSHADASEELATRSATLDSLERSYRDTKRALTKIEAGAYGKCEICQETISPERLSFKPDARTCTLHLNEESSLAL